MDDYISWYSAPASYGSSLGSNPDISHKYKLGNISKGVAIPSYRLRDELVIGIGEPREECPQEEPACQDGRHPHYPRKPSHLNMTPVGRRTKVF